MDFIKAADWVVELGPKGGSEGGYLLAKTTPIKLMKKNTPTGKALSRIGLHKIFKKNKEQKKSSSSQDIIIKKASHNNLKHIDVTIPHNKMIVFSGPSGSGKTSLAIDTIYTEACARYTDTLPAYLRSFIKQNAKPRSRKNRKFIAYYSDRINKNILSILVAL